MTTQLETNQTLLFIGDSITDCARRERDIPLGVGYVRMFSDLLSIREPDKRIRIVNRGIGGNTVEDLRSRWSDDVLAHQPDWLVVKIGINDVNRHLCCGVSDSLQCPEKFAAIYDQIMARTRQELPAIQILIASPFYLSRDTADDSYRAKVKAAIPAYIAAVHDTAQRHGARYLDLHSPIQALMRRLPPDTLSEDMVHPTAAGALFIAEQIYAALSR